jgi:D-alanyl-lipoteichoic acid acyltransferase DltB (MBOAT superfamily)
VTYLVLYTPSIKSVVTNTQSNFETSGGFGPNQMSTILGFGIFVFFVQLILNSPTRKLQILNASLVIIFAFRGLVTFSRGGVMTGVMMILLLTLLLYYKSNKNGKLKISVLMVFIGIASLGIWTYSTLQTSGMINKRYANEDARGRQKKSKLSRTMFHSFLNYFSNLE